MAVFSDKAARLKREYKQKNEILSAHGSWLAPDEFYDLVFHGADDERVMLVEAGKRYLTLERDAAIEYSLGRDDVYFCASHFYDGFKRDEFIDWIYAFVVDLDNLSPVVLGRILKGILERGTAPLPTICVNSGSGVHFYYVLESPLHTYPSVRQKARDLYDALNAVFEYSPDKHSIGHAFRGVGCLTKLGDVASGFRMGDLWSVEDLGDAVGYNWYIPDMSVKTASVASEKMVQYANYLAGRYGAPEPNYDSFIETHEFIETQTKKHFRQTALFGREFAMSSDIYLTTTRPNGRPEWYRQTRSMIIEKTELEHRYKSLMALAVIAYKCQISFEQLERDIDHIVNFWLSDPRWVKDPFNKKNVKDALRCYSQKFVKVRRETLEEWLGWSFPGSKPKPKYKDQAEWLETLADQRNGASLRAIRNALREDPTLSKAQIAKRTGLCRQTVYKHYDAAMAYIKK